VAYVEVRQNGLDGLKKEVRYERTLKGLMDVSIRSRGETELVMASEPTGLFW
jgi:hypothetical protein